MRAALRRGPGSRGFLSAGTAVVLLVSSVAMVTGTGFKFGETKLRDGVTWIFNRKDGEVARVNGSSGKVELKIALPGSSGKDLEIVQRDNAVLVVDRETGEVASLDVNGLEVAARTDFGTTEDLDVVIGDDVAYVVDRVGGTVQRVDPADLRRIGAPLAAGEQLTEGVADNAGRLWVARNATGEIIRLDPDGSEGLVEKVRRQLAGPDARLEITLVDDAIVVTDAASGKQWRLDEDGNDIGSYEVDLPPELPDERLTPPVSSGPYVPITVGDPEEPSVVAPPTQPGGGGPVREPVPLDQPDDFELPQPAVTLGDRMYVPVPKEGVLLVLDLKGRYLETISVPGDGSFELILDDGRLWVNDPDDPKALRIDEDGVVTEVEKAAEEVPSTPPTTVPDDPEEPEEPDDPEVPEPPVNPGGNDPGTTTTTAAPPVTTTTAPAPTPTTVPEPPPATTVPSTTTTTEPVPDPERPEAVTGLAVTAGDRSLVLTWGAAPDGGAAVRNHEVTWTPQGGCGQAGSTRSGPELTFTVGELANGCTYAVTVAARNPVGTGPDAAGEGTPTSDVPGAPAAPSAESAPADGSTTVAWQQPDLNGLPLAGYRLTATSNNQAHSWTQEVPAGQTQVVVPGADGDSANALTYGRGYTFTVAAVTAQQGPPSPPSAEVRPYTGPAGITIVSKTRVGPQRWAYVVEATWRGQVGTIQAGGMVNGTQQGEGQRTFEAQIPWGQGGTTTFQACLDGAGCAAQVQDNQRNPLPSFTGNLQPRWGPCVLNPDAGNGVAANDQVYENASWAVGVDFGGEGARQYVEENNIQYRWEYAYGVNQGSPDVSTVTYANPGSGQISDGEMIIPSRRHEDAYTWWVGIRFRVQGHDGWIETSVNINSPDCPGDN